MIQSIAYRAARLLAVVVMASVIAMLADPYIGFGSNLVAIAINAVLPVLLVLFLCGLTGRAWLALLVEYLLLWLIRYADHTKVTYLGINLVYADLTVLGGFLKNPHLVIGFLHPTVAKVAGALAAVTILVALCVFLRRRWPYRFPALADKYMRITYLILAVAGTVGVECYRAPDVVSSLGWEVFSQISGAHRAGITGNLLLGKMTARSTERKPDRKAIDAFWREPSVKAAMADLGSAKNGSRPDIVIIQSESLFEPSQLCEFPDQPVLKHVAQQQPQGAGNLHVPVFGGRTLQTEFEVLSGMPVKFYPGSMFAYYEVVNHPFAALPGLLDRIGYKTLAIHPGNRGFWRRDMAMPDMGFDVFEDIGSFLYPRDFSDRGHVRDAALMRAILAELDAASGPTFITAITMDNHFPYGDGAPPVDAGLGLPAKLNGEGRREMADYLVHAIDADNAYGFLLDALKRRDRPTMVLFYGDHLPPLSSVYQTLCFKDGKRPEEHLPPFRVWANFPLPKIPETTYSYLLSGWLMHAAGLPLEGTMLANAVAGSVAHNPNVDEGVRQRVLGEYANIAAANVAKRVPLAPGRGPVFVGREHALKLLMNLPRKSEGVAGISPEYNDLYFPSPSGGRIDFKLNGGVSLLTLRPYLGTPEAACMNTGKDEKVDFGIEGDGKLLYRASVTSQTVRLATLDLQGVKQLKLWSTGSGDNGACSELFVRVASMRCYSAKCMNPGQEGAAAPISTGKSRLIGGDPADGDIAALTAVIPESVRLSGGEMSALSWLMEHEAGRQQGYSPLALQSDNRLFMHPADDHAAWIDFNVDGVDELIFSPHINTLSPECAAKKEPGKEAGLVGLVFELDGKPAMPSIVVDRNYAATVPIKIGGAHVLRISVDKGNQVTWCDGFSIGVDKLKLKDPGSSPSATRLPDVTASYRTIPPSSDH